MYQQVNPFSVAYKYLTPSSNTSKSMLLYLIFLKQSSKICQNTSHY